MFRRFFPRRNRFMRFSRYKILIEYQKFTSQNVIMSSPVILQLPTVTFSKNRKKRSASSVPCCGKKENENFSPRLHEEIITVLPVVVDFERLLKEPNKSQDQVVNGIENKDLLHGCSNLYGVSLPELTDDIIYPTLCEKWSRTLLLLRDENEVAEDLNQQSRKEKDLDKFATDISDKEKIVSLAEQAVNIFSDEESADEEEEEQEDNWLSQVPTFLQQVKDRYKKRQEYFESQHNDLAVGDEEKPRFPKHLLGIENRVIASATFERSYDKPGQRVLQVTLIAVRKKYRHLGLGHYMMKQIHDSTITGGSDVIVVNADQNAVDFFEKEGFTDDVLLNSPYAHIGDIWFNSKRMCYLPSYVSSNVDQSKIDSIPVDDPTLAELNLREMELETALWREKSLQAYQAQAQIVRRMRQEVLALRAKVSVQDEIIVRLQKELEAAKESKLASQESNLRKRLSKLREAMQDFEEQVNIEDEGEIRADSACSSSAQDISSYKTDSAQRNTITTEVPGCSYEDEPKISQSDQSTSESSCELSLRDIADHVNVHPSTGQQQHHDDLKELQMMEIQHCFVASMDSGEYNFSGTAYHVTNIVNTLWAMPAPGVVKLHEKTVKACRHPDIVANLYFCGTQGSTTNDRMLDILTKGFSTEDFAQSDYGIGLHFSRHARAAARFSPTGKILVAKVCLGSTQTVTAKDRCRSVPPDGYDSILTQGRLSSLSQGMQTGHLFTRSSNTGYSEYIVFNVNQALPLAFIEYNLIF